MKDAACPMCGVNRIFYGCFCFSKAKHMTKFNPHDKPRLTFGETLGPAMNITDEADAAQAQAFTACIGCGRRSASRLAEKIMALPIPKAWALKVPDAITGEPAILNMHTPEQMLWLRRAAAALVRIEHDCGEEIVLSPLATKLWDAPSRPPRK